MSGTSSGHSTNIMFSTSANVAGQQVGAALYLVGTQPSLIVVDQIPTVSFSAIYNQFASHGSWPSQAFDMTLSNSVIVYLMQELEAAPPGLPVRFPVDVKQLKQGFYVATGVTVSVGGVAVVFTTTIRKEHGGGLGFDIDLSNPLTLFDSAFLILSDEGFLSVGPHFEFSGEGATLTCGATLFGTQFGTASVTLSGGTGTDPDLAATLTYSGQLMGAENPSLSFTWNKTNGFHLTNFPILMPTALIDIVNTLKTISAAAGCGALVGFALNQVCTTAYYVTPSVTTVPPSNAIVPPQPAGAKPIYVVISGYYKISFPDGTTLQAIDLPQLVLTLQAPNSFSFATILQMIGTFIEQNATAVVQQLWNDQPALGAFLLAAVAPNVLAQIGANLACAGLKRLFTNFEEALPKGWDVGDVPPPPPVAFGWAATGVAALAAAGQACAQSGGRSGQALPAPSISSVSYQNNAVSGAWSSVPNAGGYRAQLIDANRQPVGTVQFLPAGTLSATFPLSGAQIAVGVANVQVLARAPGGSPPPSVVDSPFANAQITKLPAPTGVTHSADATAASVTVSWQAVSGAMSYLVGISLGGKAAGSATVTAPPLSHNFFVTDFGSYGASVQALNGTAAIPSDQAHSSSIEVYPGPPTNFGLRWDSKNLGVYWQTGRPMGGGQPVTYAFNLYDDSNPAHVVGTAVGPASPDDRMTSVAITRSDGQPIAPGQRYHAACASVVGSHTSAYGPASPVFTVAELPTPQVNEPTFENSIVTASWSPVPVPAGLTGQMLYTAELATAADPDTMLPTPRMNLGLPDTSATLRPHLDLEPAVKYVVRVLAFIHSQSSAPGYSPPFEPLAIPVVSSMVYDAAANTVAVTWGSVAGAGSYDASLSNPPSVSVDQEVHRTVQQEPGPSQVAILPMSLPGARSIIARVAARRGPNRSYYSIDPTNRPGDPARLTLQRLDAPSITKVSGSVAAGSVTVTWSDAQPPSGVTYVLELLGEKSPYPVAQTSATSAAFVIPRNPSAGPIGGGNAPPSGQPSYKVRVRATTPTALGLWSAEAPVSAT